MFLRTERQMDIRIPHYLRFMSELVIIKICELELKGSVPKIGGKIHPPNSEEALNYLSLTDSLIYSI